MTQDAYDERGLELGEDVTNVGSNQTPELEALFAAQPDLVLLTPDLDGQLALAEPWLRPAFPPLGSRWSPSPTTSPCWRSAPV